ncbi:hypothetical protein PQ459_10030 [Chryseobacterium sp. KACC 21268]|nr:hypothetical protein PQ459_10030 [Chryseobacterium sp. KACC 21268]
MNDIGAKFALVGNFVYSFESVVTWIRHSCEFLLTENGLRDDKIAVVIFGNKMFSAEPLSAVYEAMVNEILKDKTDPVNIALLAKLSQFRKDFVKLTEFRNQLLHGQHLYYDGIEGMEVLKLAPNKNGYKTDKVMSLPEELSAKIKDANRLFKIIREILFDMIKIQNERYSLESLEKKSSDKDGQCL